MNLEEIAYTAGIIDGEGYIGICKGKRAKGNSIRYRLIVGVTNLDYNLVTWLQSLWGGSVFSYMRNRRNTTRIEWQWRIHCNQASNFLIVLLPYLKVKTNQAELAIAFQQKKKPSLPKSQEDATLEEIQYFLLKNMKQVYGIGASHSSHCKK